MTKMRNFNPHGRARRALACASERWGWRLTLAACLMLVPVASALASLAAGLLSALATPCALAALALAAWHFLSRRA